MTETIFKSTVVDNSNGAQPFSNMTLRQYAAIKLKVPESGAGWLDHMIKVSLHDEFAAKAMQALASQELPESILVTDVAKAAYEVADAMLEARKGGV